MIGRPPLAVLTDTVTSVKGACSVSDTSKSHRTPVPWLVRTTVGCWKSISDSYTKRTIPAPNLSAAASPGFTFQDFAGPWFYCHRSLDSDFLMSTDRRLAFAELSSSLLPWRSSGREPRTFSDRRCLGRVAWTFSPGLRQDEAGSGVMKTGNSRMECWILWIWSVHGNLLSKEMNKQEAQLTWQEPMVHVHWKSLVDSLSDWQRKPNAAISWIDLILAKYRIQNSMIRLCSWWTMWPVPCWFRFKTEANVTPSRTRDDSRPSRRQGLIIVLHRWQVELAVAYLRLGSLLGFGVRVFLVASSPIGIRPREIACTDLHRFFQHQI